MTHTHTTQTIRNILGSTLNECYCGARKWSNDRAIVGGALDAQGWYVTTETPEAKIEAERLEALEMLETEGYGYGTDKNDPLDSHHPDFQD